MYSITNLKCGAVIRGVYSYNFFCLTKQKQCVVNDGGFFKMYGKEQVSYLDLTTPLALFYICCTASWKAKNSSFHKSIELKTLHGTCVSKSDGQNLQVLHY